MTSERRAELEWAYKALNIDPMTMPFEWWDEETPPPPSFESSTLYTTKKLVFIPLTEEELSIVEENLPPAGPQGKISTRELVNDLLAVALGTAWSRVKNGSAARMRLQRGSFRGDFALLHKLVESRHDVFGPQRVETFRRVASMETAIANRRG